MEANETHQRGAKYCWHSRTGNIRLHETACSKGLKQKFQDNLIHVKSLIKPAKNAAAERVYLSKYFKGVPYNTK